VKKCRVGVIGAGRMAGFHLEVLTAFDDVEVAAITNQGNKGRTAKMCAQFQIPKSYQDYTEMLDCENLDVVFICVSVVDNYIVTKECLLRKIACLIEKPPGISVQEVVELQEIAEAHNVIHIVGLQRRFSSHILEGLKIIQEHGPLYSIVVEAPEHFIQIKAKNKFSDEILSKWIFSNSIHCLDMLPFLGGEIAEVTAERFMWRETLHPDSLHALIRFKNNAVGHYISNWSSPGGWSVKIYGDGCRVDIQPMEKGRVTFDNGKEQDLPINQADIDFKSGLYAQNRMLIDACLHKGKIMFPAATLRESIVSMALAETILDGSKVWSEDVYRNAVSKA